MSDCPNAEIRDLLPDLLHDRLDARTRARVVAHVDGCADCRSELELLRSMRGSFERGTPRVDVDRIVAALPTPSSVRAPQRRRGWRMLNDWRVAAAVTFLVAGGTSLVVIRNARDAGIDSTNTVSRGINTAATETTTRVDSATALANAVRHPASRGATSTTPTRPQPVTTPQASRGGNQAVASTDEQGAGVGSSRIGDLNERQLKSLLNQIDRMEATPITDPEPVVLRVGQKTASPTGL